MPPRFRSKGSITAIFGVAVAIIFLFALLSLQLKMTFVGKLGASLIWML